MAKAARPFFTFDLETDPFKNGRLPKAFAAGVSLDGETSSIFWGPSCLDRLVAFFHHLGTMGPFVAYAHNGGKFDFHFIIAKLCKTYGHENIKVFIVGNRVVQIKTPLYELRDSYAIIPRPLRDLGTANKHKKEIDISKLEANCREIHREEICDYLSADCTALYAAVKSFRETYGAQSLTLASSASRYMAQNYEIKIPTASERFDATFRPFYFGGRVEFFRLGEIKNPEGIKVLDINSAYPYAMLSDHFWSTEYRATKTEPKKFFEQSFYEIECDSRGAFPIRATETIRWKNNGLDFTAEKGAVCFPHGRFLFRVTGWELKAARELGLITREKVLKCYVPTATQSFGEYVGHFYELKARAETPGERTFAKLFLNGYYGKTASNPAKFREYRLAPYGETVEGYAKTYEVAEHDISFHSKKLDDAQKRRGYKNVACGASVTGYVRAMLLRAIHSCEEVFYCDTDSVIARGVKNLPQGPELGAWKLEADVTELHIAGKKNYALRDAKGKEKMACKGSRLTFDQMKKLAAGEDQFWTFDAPALSLASAPKFISRTIRRADKIGKASKQAGKPVKGKK